MIGSMLHHEYIHTIRVDVNRFPKLITQRKVKLGELLLSQLYLPNKRLYSLGTPHHIIRASSDGKT